MIKIDWTCKRQKFTALNQAPRNEENSNGGGGVGGYQLWNIVGHHGCLTNEIFNFRLSPNFKGLWRFPVQD